MLPIGVLTTLAALGSLLGKLLQVLFRVLRKRFPAFDRWLKRHLDPIFLLLRIVVYLIAGLLLALIALPLYPVFMAWSYFTYYRDRQAARDPLTTPEQLEELAKISDSITRQAVASNPNTSPETLLKLGKYYPRALLSNPTFALMLLEDPNLLLNMPRETLRSILMQKNIPSSFLEQAANDPTIGVEVARVIAQHPKSTRRILNKIDSYCFDKTVRLAQRRSLLRCSNSSIHLRETKRK